MQYDLKTLSDETTVKLEWHGEPTMVLIKGEGAKTPVEKGDVLEVCLSQAKELLRYSHLWTLEGDKPVKHGYEKAMADIRAKESANSKEKAKKADEERAEVIAKLEELNVEFDESLSTKKLQGILEEEERKLGVLKEKEGDKTDVTATDEKKKLMKALKKLEVTFNDQATVEELQGLLDEKNAELEAEKAKKDAEKASKPKTAPKNKTSKSKK